MIDRVEDVQKEGIPLPSSNIIPIPLLQKWVGRYRLIFAYIGLFNLPHVPTVLLSLWTKVDLLIFVF